MCAQRVPPSLTTLPPSSPSLLPSLPPLPHYLPSHTLYQGYIIILYLALLEQGNILQISSKFAHHTVTEVEKVATDEEMGEVARQKSTEDAGRYLIQWNLAVLFSGVLPVLCFMASS